jgi:hypothetical protein
MSKLIIYASNLGKTPKNLTEIVNLAAAGKKFRVTEVSDDAYLASVSAGDNLITGKGNNLYVVKVYDSSYAELTGADRDYVNNLYRNYGLKESNVTKVSARVKYETWCKDAAEFSIKKSKTSKTTTMTGNSIKNIGERLKANFMPTEAKDVRIAMDGNICVATSDGYVAIDKDYVLTSYPTEATLAFPVFTMPKPVDQLQAGDVIARDRSYAKVKSIKDGKIAVVGYTGNASTIHPIKDFFLGQTTVRVVVSLAGNLGNTGINPAMLMLLSKDKGNDSLLPFLLLNQNGGALTANPMAMLALAGDGDFDIKDLLMYSAMSGQSNPFANLFGGAAAPVAPTAEVKAE